MYASPNEDAKQVLLGFNEKVTHLEKTRFYQRYKDELPNLLMLVDRIDKVESQHHENEPRINLTFQGYMRFSIESFDREEIEAFVLTYRILTQQNDRYSVRGLADVYSSSWVNEDGRRAFEEARAGINAILESYTKMDFGDGAVRVNHLVHVLVYGALAHSNPSKERQYKAWTENPTTAAAAWIEFMGALLAVMRIFRHMRDVNSTLLYNVFEVALPDHLLPLVQQTLEIICLRPGKVDAENTALFKRTVLDTGEVNLETLSALYQRAHNVCFARLDGQLAGVGALKRPYAKHRAKVFKQSKSELDPKLFSYELGWFHVLNRFKGRHISSHIVEQVMKHADDAPVYATSRVNNGPMHSALIAHGGFVREGSEYPSEQGDVPLCLFVRSGQAK
jgi:hypothetical protein